MLLGISALLSAGLLQSPRCVVVWGLMFLWTHLSQELTSVLFSLTSHTLVLDKDYRTNGLHKAVSVFCGQLEEKHHVDISRTWLAVLLPLVPAFSLVCSMQIWDLVFHLKFCLGLNPSSRDDAAKFSLVLCQEQLWIEAGTEPGM